MISDNSNKEDARKRHPHFWQRLSPFLDVIGAMLMFGSWIFSNSLSERAQHQANLHDSVVSRVREFRVYGDFAFKISEIQSDLARTRNLVEESLQTDNARQGNAQRYFSEAPTWSGMTTAQIGELNDFVDDLADYAEQLSTSESVLLSTQTARQVVQTFTRQFDSAWAEFDALVQNRKAVDSAKDDAEADQKEEELRNRVDHLWQDYGVLKQNMAKTSNELLVTAAKKSEAASRLAGRCQYLSWVLYVVGTLVILYGRAKSALSTRKKQSNEDKSSPNG